MPNRAATYPWIYGTCFALITFQICLQLLGMAMTTQTTKELSSHAKGDQGDGKSTTVAPQTSWVSKVMRSSWQIRSQF